MKKLLILLLALILCSSVLVSCGKDDAQDTDSDTDTETAAETEAEVWAVGKELACEAHHKDYHYIPYNLVLFIGSDKSNEWAEEIRVDEVTELTDEVKCGCPDFNIKAYIDYFNVSKEDFVKYGDMVYLATYDTDVLYNKTPEEIADYYIYSEELIDMTIKSQHFQFIEKYFQYEYTNEIYDLIIYDEEAGRGLFPSVPQAVQSLGITKEEFDDILAACTSENERVYGRSYNYDYDISLIFNEDGTYATLPVYEGLSELDTVVKLNRVFCGRDQ